MSIRTENEKSARFSYLVRFGSDLALKRFEFFSVYFARLSYFIVYVFGSARCRNYRLFVISELFEFVLRKKFRISSEHDIRTASRHIRGYRDRAVFSRLSDYLRLFLVIL